MLATLNNQRGICSMRYMMMESCSTSTEILLNLHYFDKINLQHSDIPASFGHFKPSLFWNICIVLTNLNHLDAQFDSKSKPIPFAVSKGTNEYSGQSEHSELIRPLVVLQARGRISLWNAQPIGCDPGGVLEITFFLEKKMILLHRSPAGRLCRPPTG